ncbi:MAG: sigma-54-dependent Fis family transcriptional regulator [Pirellulales bacterium]|nr:sigma-54-dependent Fis family transcriptional regulator [Pirellulales bacterium]
MSRRILVIANDSAVGLNYERALCPLGYDVQFFDDPSVGIEAAAVGGFDLVLISQGSQEFDLVDVLRDVRTADVSAQVVVVSRKASVEAAVAAMREGAADYLPEPSSPEELRWVVERVEQLGGLGSSTARALVQPRAGKLPAAPHAGFEGILGECAAMREVFDFVRRIAPADSTVLVTGESGTGKEMIVRAIHLHSRRRERPFLACDCTALAPTLLESELFGHVKGSFSGAIATKKGLFEVAHQGTLLLDEVANLSLETQGKLLRVLETRMVRKVGDTAEHEVDIRLVATTNRSLAEMVKVGAFRADLYYRLNVVPISLPPLRERAGDIPLLVRAFLKQFSRQMGLEPKGFSEEALRQMEVYPWPGNVRELRNIVERLAVLYGGTQIELCHLPAEIREARPALPLGEVPRTWDDFKRMKRRIVDDLEYRFLLEALNRSAHNITQAAESVGMQRTNFHALLRNHGLKPNPNRNNPAADRSDS